jgi:Zn-finger nucleic acid-binding protein
MEVELGPVHIEHCNKCNGIFLDKGELDEAVQAVSGSTVRQVMTLAGSFARELTTKAAK